MGAGLFRFGQFKLLKNVLRATTQKVCILKINKNKLVNFVGFINMC